MPSVSKQELLFVVIGFILAAIIFGYQSVCQDSTTGNLSAVPWWYPCPQGSSATTSASTD